MFKNYPYVFSQRVVILRKNNLNFIVNNRELLGRNNVCIN